MLEDICHHLKFSPIRSRLEPWGIIPPPATPIPTKYIFLTKIGVKDQYRYEFETAICKVLLELAVQQSFLVRHILHLICPVNTSSHHQSSQKILIIPDNNTSLLVQWTLSSWYALTHPTPNLSHDYPPPPPIVAEDANCP